MRYAEVGNFTRCSILVLCHIALLFFMPQSTFGQTFDEAEVIKQEIVAEGFENVFIEKTDSVTLIGYENRRYRFEPAALAKVLEIANASIKNLTSFLFVIHYQGIPMLYANIHSGDYSDYLDGKLTLNELSKLITISMENDQYQKSKRNTSNKAFLKADIAIVPQYRGQFGDFSNPVKTDFDLAPELNMQLTRGLSIKAQLKFPVYNDFIGKDGSTAIEPGLLTLNQLVRLEDNFFVNATAGFFTLNRAGGNLELKKYFGNGNFAIGASTGYTAFHNLTSRSYEYFEDDSYITGILLAEYRYLPYDVTGKVQIGNFLYNNLAARFDILRQFGEVKIGFFALAAQSDEFNGGFNLAIPLPPRKFMKPRFIRIRQADEFKWEYGAKSFIESGILHKTGSELNDIMLEFNPDFFKKRLINSLPK
ncbi:MAG TPA: YjbH domain-containing protein [Bacteroidales bacterium]|nr:YjbH domain-containing protein [Bacteroidales bacterium]